MFLLRVGLCQFLSNLNKLVKISSASAMQNRHHRCILSMWRISLIYAYSYVPYQAEELPITHFFPASRRQAVQGTGLAFIVYSEAIKNMEVPQLYSVLYFIMLLMLGIGSMLGNTAAILTPLTDSRVIAARFPKEVISGKHLPRAAHVCESFGVPQPWRVLL